MADDSVSRPADTWEPGRYHRFREHRSLPFHDLLALVRPCPGGRLVDLGCGSGELTATAVVSTGAAQGLGVDASPAMLAAALELDAPHLSFRIGDLAALDIGTGWDVVLANASLHWVPDHPAVLADWRARLSPGGQIALQVPANLDHPAHTTITQVLHEEPFLSALAGEPPPDPLESVLTPERYAQVLWDLGAEEQHVRAQVYGMEMADPGEVADWTAGTALNRVRAVLDGDLFSEFERRYREQLSERLGHASPYFFAFKRILAWARFP